MSYRKYKTVKDIEILYTEIKAITKNFTDFSAEKLAEKPSILTILRLAAGMSQPKFAQSIGTTRSIIAHYDVDIAKKIKTKNAQRISKELRSLIPSCNFSEQNIIKNFKNFMQFAQNGQNPEVLRNYGRKAIKFRKPTIQENDIENFLTAKKKAYEKDGIIENEGLVFSFDFVLPDTNKPRTIIECKQISTKNKRSHIATCYRIGYEIAYKFRILKKKYPNSKRILLLNASIEKIPERVLLILKNETDAFLINPSEKVISNII